MLALTLTLPADQTWPVLKRIGLPVIALYPLATILVGKILSDQESHVRIVQDLRKAMNDLDLTLHSIGDAVLSTDARGAITRMNPVAEHLTGWTIDEATGRPLSDVFQIVDESTRAPVDGITNTVLCEGAIVDLGNHTVLIARDGSERCIVDSAAPIRDENGVGGGMVLVFSDQTQQRAARRALEERESRLRAIVENEPECVKEVSVDGRLLNMNPAGLEMIEARDGAEVFGRPIVELVHPEDRVSFLELHERVAGGETGRLQFRTVGRKGMERWMDTHSVPLRAHDGSITSVLSVTRDISEQRRANASLLTQAQMLDSIGQSVIARDLEDTIIYANRAAGELYGRSPAEMLGLNVHAVRVLQDTPGWWQQTMSRLRRGEVYGGDILIETHSGRVFPALVGYSPMMDETGTLVGIIGIVTDITDRRQLEAQYLQAQKMESVGRLAGGVAHDFNNLLTVINGIADLALTTVDEVDPLHTDLLDIRQAGERAASLTRQLLAFSRLQILKMEVLGLNTVVANLMGMLRRLIGEDIELAIKPGAGMDTVRVDPGSIEQVIMNLAVNARDAMPAGGTLTIETGDVELDDAYAAEHPSVQPGAYVMLAISDTGVGMDESTRAKIFEPFFTTKERGQGTGLGLATVFGIVKQSGGSIWVYSEVGMGTTFKIYLPRVDDEACADEPATAPAAAPGAGTILIVEDEEALLRLARRILLSAGYAVLAAANGEEARRMLEGDHPPVDLVLTDVVLPGISGSQLARWITNTHPKIKVVLTSGYTDDALVRCGVFSDRYHFIGKPYTAQELTAKLHEVLHAPDLASPEAGPPDIA
jgi:PAS domain S-box/PAS domain S-box/PAS domain S-box